MDRVVDDSFDRIEKVLDRCDLAHVRERMEALGKKLGVLEAERLRDTADPHVEMVRHAQDLMMRRLTDPMSIAEVAEACNLSPTTLKQTFRAVEGVPFYRWYRAARIRRACELLVETELPIAQVGAAVGYANPSKFASAFRAEKGMAPRTWRAGLC